MPSDATSLDGPVGRASVGTRAGTIQIGPVLTRLIRSVAAVLGAVIVVFAILRLAPGDPARLLLGPQASSASVAALRSELGLDDPILVQLVSFLGQLAQGDLGTSLLYDRPNLDLILQVFPNTVLLSVAAMAISVAVAVPAGVISALRPGSWMDRLTLTGVLIVQSLPTFWIGIVLIMVFSVSLGWLPTSGSGDWTHLVLPAITLATFQLALLARTIRSGLLEVLAEDYIRAARARGLRRRTVLVGHAARNALLPVVTVLALQFGELLGGAIITEAVFSWPGLGNLAFSAIGARDYPLLQAIVLFSAVLIVLMNLLADALYPVIDPRLRQ
jgi:peptide/nickel transport system permease protein